LKEAGCEKYFSDRITGSKFERKGLEELLFVRGRTLDWLLLAQGDGLAAGQRDWPPMAKWFLLKVFLPTQTILFLRFAQRLGSPARHRIGMCEK
jgi:hypothetical protein